MMTPLLLQETAYLKTPLGWLEIQVSKNAVTKVSFVENPGRFISVKSHKILKDSLRQLEEYFSGRRCDFDLPLDPQGTDFQKKVWKALSKIPFGKTCSYGDIAKKIGNSKASRAVGGANNKNPIAVIVPCHRVIGADGKLVGYGGGINKKNWLLDHEKINFVESEFSK